MPEMTDPSSSLIGYQQAYEDGRIAPVSCALHPELAVLMDDANGKPRVTYALIDNDVVKVVVVYIFDQRIEGIPSFELGYAVDERFRRRGIATDVLRKSVEEMRNGFGRVMKAFYIQAVVGVSNIASQKVAERILSSEPEAITDCVSGLPAFSFLRLVEC